PILFVRYCALRNLHSFPTRRSSDLWSLQPLRTSSLGSIDEFVRAKLKDAGLAPSPPADKRTLIRRATVDLTGLPPTPEEIDAFLDRKSTRLNSSHVEISYAVFCLKK